MFPDADRPELLGVVRVHGFGVVTAEDSVLARALQEASPRPARADMIPQGVLGAAARGGAA